MAHPWGLFGPCRKQHTVFFADKTVCARVCLRMRMHVCNHVCICVCQNPHSSMCESKPWLVCSSATRQELPVRTRTHYVGEDKLTNWDLVIWGSVAEPQIMQLSFGFMTCRALSVLGGFWVALLKHVFSSCASGLGRGPRKITAPWKKIFRKVNRMTQKHTESPFLNPFYPALHYCGWHVWWSFRKCHPMLSQHCRGG